MISGAGIGHGGRSGRPRGRTAAKLLSLLLVLSSLSATTRGAPVELREGDRIVFVGNTFAERMGLFPYFETLLTLHFPELGLTFRNLGWSADTLSLQPRPLNFGDMFSHLTTQRTDVVIAAFGLNEAFDGPEGLDAFEREWRVFLGHMSHMKFNGVSPPRLVMVSPTAHERLGGDLPDPSAHNRNLELYTSRMRRLAQEHGVSFVDLFSLTRTIYERSATPLTLNGIHLTEYGYWLISRLMLQELGWWPEHQTIEVESAVPGRLDLSGFLPLPLPPAEGSLTGTGSDLHLTLRIRNLAPGRYALRQNGRTLAEADAGKWAEGVVLDVLPAVELAESLHETVREKNQRFFHRWRAVNGEYIYGRRMEPFGIENFPGEMAELDRIVASLDRRIHELGRSVSPVSLELVATND